MSIKSKIRNVWKQLRWPFTSEHAVTAESVTGSSRYVDAEFDLYWAELLIANPKLQRADMKMTISGGEFRRLLKKSYIRSRVDVQKACDQMREKHFSDLPQF